MLSNKGVPLLGPAADKGVSEWLGSRVFQIFLFPALGGLLFGYDIGATSYVITQLKSSEYSGTTWHSNVDDSTLLEGAITSAGTIELSIAPTRITRSNLFATIITCELSGASARITRSNLFATIIIFELSSASTRIA